VYEYKYKIDVKYRYPSCVTYTIIKTRNG